jgi:hypothetical protein
VPSQLSQRSRAGILPPPRVSIAVRTAVLASGARATAALLGLSDTTTARIAARLPCHRASIELAARRLGIDIGLVDDCKSVQQDGDRTEGEVAMDP